MRYQQEAKLLILGPSDCGKSTLLKQLKIAYAGGFTDIEKEQAKLSIRKSCFEALSLIVTKLSQGKESSDLMEKYEDLTAPRSSYQTAEQDEINLMKSCWEEQSVKLFYSSRGHDLPETTDYFLDQLDRVMSNSYIPTNDDILKLRIVTQSVSDNVFMLGKDRMHFIDVSGLKYHRYSCLYNIQIYLAEIL
jgi:hypothetical protein